MSEREEKTDERERSSFLGEKKKGDALSHASESCSAVHKRTERDGDGVATEFGADSLKKQNTEAPLNQRPPAMVVEAAFPVQPRQLYGQERPKEPERVVILSVFVVGCFVSRKVRHSKLLTQAERLRFCVANIL